MTVLTDLAGTACGETSVALGYFDGVIDGVIMNANGEKLILEHLSAGMPVVIDTVALNESGKFSFKPELEKGGPDYFSLRIGNQSIPLAFDTLAQPIHITADFKRFGSDYSVGDNALNALLKLSTRAFACSGVRLMSLEALLFKTSI